MKHNRTISYLALLSVPFLVLAAALSTSPAQARVEGGIAVVNTVIQSAESSGPVSNCLVGGGQTVLLGELKAAQSVTVELTVEGTGELTVTGQSEYLTVTTEQDPESKYTVTFAAAQRFTEQRTENVTITYGSLSGTFRVELIPQGTYVVEIPLNETTEPTDPDEPTESLPEESTDGSGEEQPTETVTPVELTLTAPAAFALDRVLPVKLTVTGEAEQVTIGELPALTRYSLNGGSDWFQLYHGGNLELTPEWPQLLLLDFSRTDVQADSILYLSASADGEVWTEASEVTACEPVPQSAAVPILRLPTDAERTALNDYLNPTAAPEAQTVEDPTETTQSAEAEEPAPQTESEPETTTAPTEFVLETLPESGVFENDYFVVPLPAGWAQPTCILERLEQKDGIRAYTTIDDQSIVLQQTEDALVVTPGTTPPKAGTYRLTIKHYFEETCTDQMQMTFFINYSTRSDAQQKEVPDNE